MKIKKEELILALDKARQFTGKSFPICEKVLIDGPASKIVATNFDSSVTVNVAIMDFIRKIEGEKPFNPAADDDLKADMETLKKDQLQSLAEYAGVDPTGTKGALIDAIMTASQASWEKADAIPAPTSDVEEKVCVDPVQLLKIVKSLEAKADDYIDLVVSDFTYRENIIESVQACALTVGDHFQKLIVSPASDFPMILSDKEIQRPFGQLRGDALGNVAMIAANESEKTYQEKVVFDPEKGLIVACDGKRIHAASLKMAPLDTKVILAASPMKALAKIAGTDEMKIFNNANASAFCFRVGANVSVVVKNDPEVNYPNYMDFIEKEQAHTVVVDRKIIAKVLSQANLMTEGAATLTFNGGINIECQSDTGLYSRENIPFIEGKVEPKVGISLNTKLLQDAIQCIGDKIKIMLNSATEIIYFTGKDFKAAIMPLRMS